jgi:hypothetical protein
MMHGRGKSDEAIVAVKPANKAERSAAELVEPRAETKGNAGWQSKRRTQSRISVSKAPARIKRSSFGPLASALLRVSCLRIRGGRARGSSGKDHRPRRLRWRNLDRRGLQFAAGPLHRRDCRNAFRRRDLHRRLRVLGPPRASIVAATRSIASRARSELLTLTSMSANFRTRGVGQWRADPMGIGPPW